MEYVVVQIQHGRGWRTVFRWYSGQHESLAKEIAAKLLPKCRVMRNNREVFHGEAKDFV